MIENLNLGGTLLTLAWVGGAILFLLISNFWPGSWFTLDVKEMAQRFRFGRITEDTRGPGGITHKYPWDVFGEVDTRDVKVDIELTRMTTGINERTMEFDLDTVLVLAPDPKRINLYLTAVHGDPIQVFAPFIKGALQRALAETKENVFDSHTLPQVLERAIELLKHQGNEWGVLVKALEMEKVYPPQFLLDATATRTTAMADADATRTRSKAEMDAYMEQKERQGTDYLPLELMDRFTSGLAAAAGKGLRMFLADPNMFTGSRLGGILRLGDESEKRGEDDDDKK